MSSPVQSRRHVHTLRQRLSYADCDPAGIVYYATWFPLMERVHTEWWLLQGLRFDECQQLFGAVPVTRATECSYLRMTRLFDVVSCGMRVVSVGRSSYRLGFDFVREADGQPVAEGSLTLVMAGPQGAVPLPDRLRDPLDTQ